ncbi:MAG: DUF4342 domain-containing protein [Firmicutes bacterium]|nr:DUF4342 domain-containing protein [Bacillota bacterium]
MEITLEKIELVKDRTGVSYREAKDALEKTDGNVVDAIILIEDNIDEGPQVSDSKVAGIIDSVKATIKKGNVSKIVIKKDDEVLINLPVSIGVIGTVLFPWAAIAGVIAAFGTKCKIELFDEKGDVVDVSEKASEAFDMAKTKGGVLVDEVKDKSGDIFEYAKDKGGDAFEYAKDKGGDAFEYAKDKGKDVLSAAKDKAKTVMTKDGEGEIMTDFGDLDLSDLDLSELEKDDE